MIYKLRKDYLIPGIFILCIFILFLFLYYLVGAFYIKSFLKILIGLLIVFNFSLTRKPFEYLAISMPFLLCTGVRYVLIHKFLIKRTPPAVPLFLHLTDFIAFGLLFYILINYLYFNKFSKDPYFKYFLLFFFSLFLSLLPSFDRFFSLFHILMFFNGYVIYRFLLNNLEKRHSNFKLFLWVYLIFITFNILIGVFQLILGYVPLLGKGFMEVYGFEIRRIRGIFVHGNSLGGVIALTIPVYVSFYFSESFKKISKFLKFAYVCFLIFLLTALFFTYSRNSLISCTLGTLFVFFLYSRKIGKLKIFLKYGVIVIFVILIAVLISKFAFREIYERITSIFYPFEDLSFQVRLHYWQNSLKTFLKHPILGIGISQFIYMPYAFLVIIPHNFYIQLLLETGLAGFISFVLLVGYIIKSLSECIRKENKNNLSWMAMGLIGSWIVFLNHNLLDSSWTTINHNEEMKVLFILITLSAFVYKNLKKTSS